MTTNFKPKDIESFDSKKLQHVDVKESTILPSNKEIYHEMLPDDLESKRELKEIKEFATNKLKKVQVVEKGVLPDDKTIQEEKVSSRAEVLSYDLTKLKSVETKETSLLPTPQELRAELMPDILPTRPELEKLQTFVSSFLKHVETVEKNQLPTKEVMEAESVNTFADVVKFDAKILKRVKTEEKNILPDVADLWSEMIPDDMPTKLEIDALKKFVLTDLKHVDPVVKSVLPTKEVIKEEGRETRADILAFDNKKLKRVDTIEKNTLPTAEVLEAERKSPEYVPSKEEIHALNSLVKKAIKRGDAISKGMSQVDGQKKDASASK